jgi:hypothetical protein
MITNPVVGKNVTNSTTGNKVYVVQSIVPNGVLMPGSSAVCKDPAGVNHTFPILQLTQLETLTTNPAVGIHVTCLTTGLTIYTVQSVAPAPNANAVCVDPNGGSHTFAVNTLTKVA